jgi:hypothetical protein
MEMEDYLIGYFDYREVDHKTPVAGQYFLISTSVLDLGKDSMFYHTDLDLDL